MMKKQILTVALTIFSLALTAQTWDWAFQAKGNHNDKGKDVITDINGNVYLAGVFESSAISFGSNQLNNQGQFDAYLSKLNNKGQHIWTKQIASTGDEEDIYITSSKSGYIYALVQFGGNLRFGTTQFNNQGNHDVAVLKFDSSGTFIWGKSFGGSLQEEGYDIIVDENENIYFSGRFLSDQVKFDNITLTRKGLGDAYVVKMNAQGQVQWAKNFGYDQEDRIMKVAISDNHLYFGCRMRSSKLTFGNITVYNSQTYDNKEIVLGKFDLNGNIKWVNAYGGNKGDGLFSIETDKSGNLYAVGQFDSKSFKIGKKTLSTKGSMDIFISKFNKNGGPVWTKTYGGSLWDRAEDVIIDNRHIYICGYSASNDLITESGKLPNSGKADAFLFKMNPNGHLLSYKIMCGPEFDQPKTITTDLNGNIFIAGHFESDTIAFDQVKLKNTKTGYMEIFVAKLKELPAYSFGGHVFAGEYPIDFGIAYLFQNSDSIPIDSMEIDTLGYYDFYKVLKGKYTVKAKLTKPSFNFGKYSPTYFGDQLTWNSAAIIDLKGNVFNADIHLQKTASSIQETPSGNISLYPNPAREHVYISLQNKAITACNIYDINGRQILSKKMGTNPLYQLKINVSRFSKGLYLVQVIDSSGKTYKAKLIR